MADIPSNITTTATFEGNPLTGASYSGIFEDFDDTDWIKVTLVAGVTYSFYANAESAIAPTGDSVLQLFDPTGTQVASNDDSGVGPNSLITYTPATSGTYFVGIHDYYGDPGLYSIGVTAVAATDRLLSSGSDFYTGHANERILGGAGDDDIAVGAGKDALGEQGDDVLYGNDNANFLSGGPGYDAIYGYGGNDKLFGDAGNDYIDGGSGADTIFGGDGKDYIIDDYGNNLIHGGNGADEIYGAVDNDTIYGDAGDDYLDGWYGNDTLNGGEGFDILVGGPGSDKLIGGLGGDRLIGGTGADSFIFTASNQSTGTGAGRDVIVDFRHSEADKISLSGIDAKTDVAGNQAFDFIGTAAFSHHSGELRYSTANGNVYVYGDTNGDGNADFSVKLENITSIVAGDFIL